jgi:hypothetical protein
VTSTAIAAQFTRRRLRLASGLILEVSSLEAKELVICGRSSPLTVYALGSIAESGA